MKTSTKRKEIFGSLSARDCGIVCLLALVSASSVVASTMNGKIAFVSDRDGNSEIYVMNPDGSEPVRLTNNDVSDGNPAWSPDGTQIAFISEHPDQQTAIYVMAADGTGRREIIRASARYLGWSPDGQQLVFDDNHGGPGSLWISTVNVDGSGYRHLVAGAWPSWSPDGHWILYSHSDTASSGRLTTRLNAVHPDGTGHRVLIHDRSHDRFPSWSPTWSPDGETFAFLFGDQDELSEIQIANADGTGRTYFHGCDGGDSFCDWIGKFGFSPDGNTLVFAAQRFAQTYGPNGLETSSDIYVKNLDGTGLKLIATDAWWPSWQPISGNNAETRPWLSGNANLNGLNVLSDSGTPYPPGCLALGLPTDPDPADATVVSRMIDVPGVQSQTADLQAEITLWRVACADAGYSVVLMRVQDVAGNDGFFVMPSLTADIGEVPNGPLAFRAQLSPRPADVRVGGENPAVTPSGDDGVTFVLGVDPLPMDASEQTVFGPEAYNRAFTVELGWDLFGSTSRHLERFTVPAFDPSQSAPQFWQPVFNGRHTGSYVVDGIPRTGLLLQVAESKPTSGLADSNFAFVTLFTYTDDGQQLWLTGNTEPGAPGMPEIDIKLYRPEGGLLFTNSPGSFNPGDVVMRPEGRLSLRVIDCNTLEGDYNFTEGALAGTGTLVFKRLIRIAGYDCNPWAD